MQHYTGKSFGPESHAVAALMIHQSHSGRSIDPEVTVALEIHTQSHWGRYDPVSPGQESCMAQSHRSHGDSQWQVLWPRVTAEELQESCMGFLSQAVIGRPSILCGRPALWQAGQAYGIVAGRHCGRPAEQVGCAYVVAGQHCGRLAKHVARRQNNDRPAKHTS